MFLFQHREEISEKISESEKLMKGLSETWEEKLEKTGMYLWLK